MAVARVELTIPVIDWGAIAPLAAALAVLLAGGLALSRRGYPDDPREEPTGVGVLRLVLAFMVALVAAVAFAVDARAQDPRVNHLRPIAAKAFPAADGRCGHVAIVLVADIERRPDGSIPEATAHPQACTVKLTYRWLTMMRQIRCAILVHEFGHIDLATGRGPHDPRDSLDHSANPHSIMYGGGLAANTVPECNRLAWAEGKLHDLRRRARDLREVRSWSSSRKRRARINRQLASVKRRAAVLRWYLGPEG